MVSEWSIGTAGGRRGSGWGAPPAHRSPASPAAAARPWPALATLPKSGRAALTLYPHLPQAQVDTTSSSSSSTSSTTTTSSSTPTTPTAALAATTAEADWVASLDKAGCGCTAGCC